jgi:hypothetical protein
MEILESERTQNTPNIYFSLGNHEYMYGGLHSESLKAFINYTKMPNHYYSVEIEGIKYIVLGSDSKVMSGTISDEQYNWFVSELESVDKNKQTFIFAHQPLKDTVSGSLYSKDTLLSFFPVAKTPLLKPEPYILSCSSTNITPSLKGYIFLNL